MEYKPFEEVEPLEQGIVIIRELINSEGNIIQPDNVKKGDDLSFAKENSNKLDWHEINVPGRWEDQCAKGYDGYAWYSKDVFIPNDWKDIDVKLYFENIDDCEEM